MGWRKKMLIVFIPLFLLSLLSSLGVSYAIISKQVLERSLKDNENVVHQIKSQIESGFQSVELFSKMICIDENINALLLRPAESISEQTNIRYEVMKLLRTYSYLCSQVDTFVIQRHDGAVFTSVRGFDEDYRCMLQEPWYTEYISAGRNGTVTSKHEFFTPYGSILTDGVSYILRYRNQLSNQDSFSYLIAEIRWQWIEKILGRYSNQYGQLCIWDREVQAMYGTLPETAILQGLLSSDSLEDENHLFFATNIEKPEWTLLLTLDKKGINDEILQQLLRYALVEGVVFLSLIAIAICFIFNRSKPIRLLSNAMDDIANGHLDTRIELHSGDELELLAGRINDMAYRLELHMAQKIRNRQEQLRLQSGLLMAQIRPHFIYNTLNAIMFLIEEKRSEDAIANTRALISLLQDTVHFCGDNSLNTLEGEMRILQHYLTIQKVRYPECVQYKTDVPLELMSVSIPRMILQPLVENALLHGIVPAGHPCALRLSATLVDNRLKLCVEDEGVGMTREQLESCLEHRESNSMRGVALSNIIERLRITYGEGNFTFNIDSRPQEGTCVTMVLPMLQGKEHNDGKGCFGLHA